jgi:hypothetical protein
MNCVLLWPAPFLVSLDIALLSGLLGPVFGSQLSLQVFGVFCFLVFFSLACTAGFAPAMAHLSLLSPKDLRRMPVSIRLASHHPRRSKVTSCMADFSSRSSAQTGTVSRAPGWSPELARLLPELPPSPPPRLDQPEMPPHPLGQLKVQRQNLRWSLAEGSLNI